jgi:hypothetical protein
MKKKIVITRSEATKQSSFRQAKLDCFASLAMTSEMKEIDQ